MADLDSLSTEELIARRDYLKSIVGDEAPAVAPESSAYDYAMGGLKGVAKGALDLFTGPADLLTRAGNYALNKITGTEVDPNGLYPSDLVGSFLDDLSNNQGNKNAELGTRLAGNVLTAFAVPSQAEAIASTLSKAETLPLWAKAIGYGTEGAAYGVLGDPQGEDLGKQALLGAGVGTAVPAAIEGGSKLLKGVGQVYNWLSPATKQVKAQQAAKELIGGISDTGSILNALASAKEAENATPFIEKISDQYLPKYKRTAEIVNQPGIAGLEKVLQQADPSVKGAIAAQDAQRELGRQALFSRANPDPMMEEQAGNAIRRAVEENLAPMKEKVSGYARKFNSIAKETIPTPTAKAAITFKLKELLSSGAKQADPSFIKLVDNFRALPKKISLETLQDYYSSLGQHIGKAKSLNATPIDKQTAQMAGVIRGTLEKAIDKAIERKELPASQAKAWYQMRGARAKMGEIFDAGPLPDILEKNPFSTAENTRYALNATDIPGKTIASVEDARAVMTAIKGNSNGVKAARGSLLNHIWEKSTNATSGEFNPNSFNRQLRHFEGIDKEILTPSQIKILGKISEDFKSQANLQKNIYSASKNQSATTETKTMIDVVQGAVKESATGAARQAVTKIPVIGPVIDALTNVVSNPKERAALLNSELSKFVLDPDYAHMLLSKDFKTAAPALNAFADRLSSKLSTLGKAAAVSATNQTKQKPDPLESLSTEQLKKRRQELQIQLGIEQAGQVPAKNFGQSIDNAFNRIDEATSPISYEEFKRIGQYGSQAAQAELEDSVRKMRQRNPGMSEEQARRSTYEKLKYKYSDMTEKKLSAPIVISGKRIPIDRLIQGVIKQESAGNAKAVGPKTKFGQAIGLMQLLPTTAEEQAKELGLENIDLTDPETNVRLGTHYLTKLTKMFKGDHRLALAAYNAGPGRVRQWIAKYGPTWDDISEGLKRDKKFKETVAYVPGVLSKSGLA